MGGVSASAIIERQMLPGVILQKRCLLLVGFAK